jgi:predicted acetyltransferase
MNEKLAVSIVRAINRDIYGRYGLEQYFRSIHPRMQVEIWEKWIHVVSVELKKAGVINEIYEPLNTEEMDFVDIVNRVDYYLKEENRGSGERKMSDRKQMIRYIDLL